MVIEVSNTVIHNAVCDKKKDFSNDELKNEILTKLQRVGINPESTTWNDRGHLQLQKPSDLKLHTLLLQMEELGMDVKLTKQTLIEIA